jgi:hypothetical protein
MLISLDVDFNTPIVDTSTSRLRLVASRGSSKISNPKPKPCYIIQHT